MRRSNDHEHHARLSRSYSLRQTSKNRRTTYSSALSACERERRLNEPEMTFAHDF